MARGQRQGPYTSDAILNKRNYSLSADIDRIVANTDKRLLMVMQASLQKVIDEAQKPVGKGGKMRVDTGFLRASGQASLTGMPSGPDVKPPGAAKGQFDDGDKVNPSVSATIGQLKFGSTLFFGWTANYARYREAYDGFLYSALQNFQQTVDGVIEEAKRRFP